MTLEKKLSSFLKLSLSAYRVPVEEQMGAMAYVASLDVRAIAEQVMRDLFQALAAHFEFSLENVNMPADAGVEGDA